MSTFPLHVDRTPGGRPHFATADGTPFLLTGDTAWSLIASLKPDEIERYLDHRAALGYNAIIVNVIEALFAPSAPDTVDGLRPFHTPESLSGPVDAYFDRVAWAFEQAQQRGILVLAAPAYLGYDGGNFPGYDHGIEGWFAPLLRAGVDGARRYGEYVGERLAHLDNILWVLLGDRDPGDAYEHVRALADGLFHARPDRLALAHAAPQSKSIAFYGEEPWFTVNSTYSYGIVHRDLIHDVRAADLPNILFETTYEGEHNASQLQVRRQAWWALTLSGAGQFLGQWPVWSFREGWEAALDSPGSRQIAHVRRFFESFPWWRTALVPDGEFVAGSHFLQEGLGEMHGLDYASTSASPRGDIVVTYVPAARPIRPDLARFGAGVWRARTFDPVAGEFVAEFDVRPGDRIEAATDHDWAVLLTRGLS